MATKDTSQGVPSEGDLAKLRAAAMELALAGKTQEALNLIAIHEVTTKPSTEEGGDT